MGRLRDKDWERESEREKDRKKEREWIINRKTQNVRKFNENVSIGKSLSIFVKQKKKKKKRNRENWKLFMHKGRTKNLLWNIFPSVYDVDVNCLFWGCFGVVYFWTLESFLTTFIYTAS